MNTLMNYSPLGEVEPRILLQEIEGESEVVLTEEEIIARAREQPEILTELITPFFAMEDEGARQVTSILASLNRESSPGIKAALVSLIHVLPSKIKKTFVKDHPDILVDSFAELDAEQRNKVVLEVIQAKESRWKGLFITIIELFVTEKEGGKGRERATRYLNLLLPAFDEETKTRWLLHYTKKMSEKKSWSFVLMTLDYHVRKLLISSLEESLDCDLSDNGYYHCLCLLSSEKDNYPREVRLVIRQIFNHFYKEGKINKILDSFDTLSESTQACLLDSMYPADLNYILDENRYCHSLLLTWLNKLLAYREDFKAKKQIISDFLPFLSDHDNGDIIETLNNLQSPWISHFLAFGSSELKAELKNQTTLDVRSNLFHNCKFDVSTRKVLKTIYHSKKLDDYISICFDLTNSAIDLEMSNHNLTTALNFLDTIEPQSLEICGALIQRIPPFIIGLTSFDKERRESVMRLVPHMSDEQLQFFVCNLTKDQLDDLIKQHGVRLEGVSLLVIFQALSLTRLCSFFEIKIEELKRYKEKFRAGYQAIVSEFDSVKRDRKISNEKLGELEQKVNHLRAISDKPNNLMFRAIKLFFERLDSVYYRKLLISSPAKKKLGVLMNQFRKECNDLISKASMFRLGGVIASEIDQMREFVEEPEIDLTEKLYLGFWLLARERTLPHLGISPHSSLGITNLGELTSVGIQSDEDLEHIGISAYWEEQIQRRIQEFEALSSVLSSESYLVAGSSSSSKRKLPELWSLWETLSRIDVESKKGNLEISNQLVKLLNISDPIPPSAILQCISFFTSLNEFKFCTQGDLTFLTKTVKNLQENKMDRALLEKSFSKGLLLLREKQPLFCLRNYLLRNENLKATWEKLRTHGYNSIGDLYKASLIEKSQQLLKLHNLTIISDSR